MFVSERLTRGTLISGALATRIGRDRSDRLVPPGSSEDGSGKTVSGGSDGFGHTVGS